MKIITKKASDYTFSEFKQIHKNIRNSYNNLDYSVEIDNGGGRGSGKTHFNAESVVFWLPNIQYHEALFIVATTSHKINTVALLEQKIKEHGYYNYKKKRLEDGTIRLYFGNDNIITVFSTSAKSNDMILDNLKAIEFENNIHGKNLKFLIFEEFTAILTSMKSMDNALNGLNGFNRSTCDSPIKIYTYNPPNHKKHKIYDFMKINPDMLRIRTNMYQLPEKFQNKEDLRFAESLKKYNFKMWEQIYMGIASASEGLAFDIDESIYTDLLPYYDEYHVQTDEATVNATTFSLFGIKGDEIHYITNFYHSSKEDGIRYSGSEYAKKYLIWLNNLKINPKTEHTDSVYFSQELINYGRINAKSIGKFKNRVLGYKLLLDLVLRGKFKIVNRPENNMLFAQMSNAEIEYVMAENSPNYGKAMISKKSESNNNNETHTHALDTVQYLLLYLQKTLI